MAVQGYFWSNTVWYLLLFILTAAMISTSLIKAQNRRFLVAFFCAVLGLFYYFEFVLVAVLDAYHYHPMLTPGDGFQDSVFGNMFSQTSIAAACILIIAYRLRPIWYVAFAVAYYLIELLFSWLGIYTLHWYQTIFTPLILVPLLWSMKLWHNRAATSKGTMSDSVLVFLGVSAAYGNTVSLPMKLAGIHVFTGGFFPDPSRDHTTTLILYLTMFAGVIVYTQRARTSIPVRLLVFAALIALQLAAFKGGLMTFRDGWFPYATLIEIVACSFWAWYLEHMVGCRNSGAASLPRNCQ